MDTNLRVMSSYTIIFTTISTEASLTNTTSR